MADSNHQISNLSKVFVQQLLRIRSAGLSAKCSHQTKRCLLDYLGATYAGGYLLKPQVSKLLSLDHAVPESGISAVGFKQRVSMQTATFINGLTSHVAELDDGVRHGMLHPGSPIISALLPAAQHFEASGDDLLMGIAIGYEAATRIATSIQSTHYQRGYHPTATCGTIGAALGVSAMLGFNEKKTEHALAASSIAASGSLKVIEKNSDLKPFNTAQSALSGLMAALTSWTGLSGPDDPLTGNTGFLQMCADSFDIHKLLGAKDEKLWIHQAYVKPYAACRHAHPAIEASLRLKQDPNLQLKAIKQIKIITYGGILGRHDHQSASSIADAKMSIPVAVATALLRGGAGIEDFTQETIKNPEINSLAKKTIIIEDPDMTKQVPTTRKASVQILTNNDQIRTVTIAHPKGEPENPMTDKELIHKYNNLARFAGIDPQRAYSICDNVLNLPTSLRALMAEL